MAKNIYLNGAYQRLHPTWHMEDSAWKAEKILGILRKNNVCPRNICEIGCGTGGILRELRKHLPPTSEFWGYDISPQAIAIAQNIPASRLHFEIASIENVPDTSYDLLMLIDVIEHAEDYYSMLRESRKRAQHVLLHVPLDISVQSLVLRSPIINARVQLGHINYFTKETVLATIEDIGMGIIDFCYTAKGVEHAPQSRKGQLARWPRKFLAVCSEDLAARYLGGFSLLILATSKAK